MHLDVIAGISNICGFNPFGLHPSRCLKRKAKFWQGTGIGETPRVLFCFDWTFMRLAALVNFHPLGLLNDGSPLLGIRDYSPVPFHSLNPTKIKSNYNNQLVKTSKWRKISLCWHVKIVIFISVFFPACRKIKKMFRAIKVSYVLLNPHYNVEWELKIKILLGQRKTSPFGFCNQIASPILCLYWHV